MKTAEIRRYRSALRKFERLIGTQLKQCSCSVTLPQCLVLLDIDEHGTASMSELASHLRLDHSTLSRTVDGLVKKGLLSRKPDAGDRRVVRVALTASGQETCEGIHVGNDAFCQGVFGQIPPAQREAVLRHFEQLVQAYLDHERLPGADI
jgi:DNA-binding MarR family transcriptional regulator